MTESSPQNLDPDTADFVEDLKHGVSFTYLADFETHQRQSSEANTLLAKAAEVIVGLTGAGQAQCCMCGKKGISTVEDGGPECQLDDDRWTCSRECWDMATGEADDDDPAYAVLKRQDDGTYSVDTPGRGFSLIKGLDEQTAYAVQRCINRAYENGTRDSQQNIRDALGIKECCHDD